MREVADILFGAAFTVAVSLALGSLLLARLRLAFYRWEAALFEFVAGAGCLSFLTASFAFSMSPAKVYSSGAGWLLSRSPSGSARGAARAEELCRRFVDVDYGVFCYL